MAETLVSPDFLTRGMNSKADFDLESRTVTSSFCSSDHSVVRYLWGDDLPEGASRIFDEVISTEVKSWDLTRLKQNNCLYLRNHDRDQQLGKVTKVWFENGKGYCERKILRTKEGDDYLKSVEDNLQPGESFGYIVHKYRVLEPAEYTEKNGYTQLKKRAKLEAVEIELLEVSSTTIPADPSVGIGSKSQPLAMRSLQIEGDPAWGIPTPGISERAADPSKWFPIAYARDLKENHPDIWKKGGNIRGNATFQLWEKKVKGEKSPAIEKWVSTERPAWIARHYQDNRLPGVVAQIKWGTVGVLGVDGMKKLVNEAKSKGKKSMFDDLFSDLELDQDTQEAIRSAHTAALTPLQDQIRELTAERDRLTEENQQTNDSVKALATRLDEAETRTQTTETYNALRSQAEKLVGSKQLAPATFARYFTGDRKSDIAELCVKSHRIEAIQDILEEAEKSQPVQLQTVPFFARETDQEQTEEKEHRQKAHAAFNRKK